MTFPQAVASLQTLDNMLLPAWWNWYRLMTLFYLGLVIVIVSKILSKVAVLAGILTVLEWYRVLVLLGFAIHSLTYDSLLFPSVNWLFHVQVGIMAGYHASDGARLSHQSGATGLSET